MSEFATGLGPYYPQGEWSCYFAFPIPAESGIGAEDVADVRSHFLNTRPEGVLECDLDDGELWFYARRVGCMQEVILETKARAEKALGAGELSGLKLAHFACKDAREIYKP